MSGRTHVGSSSPALGWVLRSVALAAALVAVPAAAGAQEAPPRMTLDEALERALARSPQLAQSEQQLVAAQQGERTAAGAFLPSLSGSWGGNVRSSQRFDPVTDEIVSAASSDSYSAGLSAGYTLFAGGERFAARDQARADLEAASARMDDQRYDVAFQTRSLFIQGLRQEELLEVARARIEQAETSLEMTRRQAQVGSATRSDSLRARLEFINAQQAVLEAEVALRNARVSLGRQVGVAGPVIPEPLDQVERTPLALTADEILARAEAASPQVVAAGAASGAAEAAVASSRTAWWPSLSLSSGLNWNSQQFGFEQPLRSWSVGLSMSYPIFNGFQREAGIARAEASYRSTVAQEQDARLGARQEADAALATLTTAERAIEIAEQGLVVAREDLRVVRQRYEVGVARIFDVITSQVALDQARVDMVTARYDYLVARAELEAILGTEL